VQRLADHAQVEEDVLARPPLLDQLMAMSRSSALEEMASGIAHEINQPLGAITTFAQAGERMLNRPDVTPEAVREVFRYISKEALAAAAGIGRIRKLFNRDNIVKTNVDFGEVVDELATPLRLLADAGRISLVVAIDAGLPVIALDRLRIQHVLYTLAQNAFDATAAAGAPDAVVRIEVKGDRYGVEIAVIDAGPGIAPELGVNMFHPFFTTKANGTGLGLASARAIVQAHEGTIGYENAPSGGTRFWFRLPATQQ
jgi:C4-dicarboxylate-specific signal transduction histidine kinase